MPEHAIVNASPLIFLSKAGLINLLQLAAPQILVPNAVMMEINRRGNDDITVQVLAKTPWLNSVDVSTPPTLIQSWDLGLGESAVLAHALEHPGITAIIDDGAGRRCAQTLEIPHIGTLGLVMIAKKRGVVPAARPLVSKLKQYGMFLSEKTINRALALIDE